jgi:hypothetical protein
MNHNDYDNDGNNIVPCPICLNVYCPSKNGGKCPDENEFLSAMNHNEIREEFKKNKQFKFIADDFPEALDMVADWWLDKLTLSYNSGIEKCLEVVGEEVKEPPHAGYSAVEASMYSYAKGQNIEIRRISSQLKALKQLT